MWYEYHQNNSGGFMMEPYGLVVEADSADEADQIAIANGVYFNGVEEGYDCSCCGERWHGQYSDEGTESPEWYGDAVPDRVLVIGKSS